MATTKKSGAKSSSKSGAKKSSSSARGASKTGSSAKKAPARGGSSASKGGATKKSSSGRSSSASKATTKRAPNPAFMKPMMPDESLAAVVGASAMPRTEITKKLWAYIKKNNLQDPKERRMINADDKLKPVFGGKKQVSMFEMTKLVNNHISGQ